LAQVEGSRLVTADVFRALPTDVKASVVDSLVKGLAQVEGSRLVTADVFKALPTDVKAAVVDSLVKGLVQVEGSRLVTADVFKALPTDVKASVVDSLVKGLVQVEGSRLVTADVFKALPTDVKASVVDSLVKGLAQVEGSRLVTADVFDALPQDVQNAVLESFRQGLAAVEGSRLVTGDVFDTLPNELKLAMITSHWLGLTRLEAMRERVLEALDGGRKLLKANIRTSASTARLVATQRPKIETTITAGQKAERLKSLKAQFDWADPLSYPTRFFISNNALGLWFARRDIEYDFIRQKYAAYTAERLQFARSNPVLGARFAAGDAAAKLMTAVNFIGDVTDVLGVLTTFSDGLLFNPEQFVNENDILSAATINTSYAKALPATRNTLVTHNRDVIDVWNAADANQGLEEFPLPKEFFPMVSGPLDWLDSETAQGDPFITQMRVYVEHHTAMEYLLRRTPYRELIVDNIGQSDYDAIVNNPSDALIYYLGGELPIISEINYTRVYEQAYRYVCTENGGQYYKTYNPDDTIQVSGRDVTITGKPKYICGWPTEDTCNDKAREWYNLYRSGGYPPGQYAEWYTWDQMRTGADGGTNELAKIDALAALYPSAGGACISTNVGLRGTCSYYKGAYNVSNTNGQPKCAFSEKFCQAQGTCYNEANQTCYLPEGAITALSMFFGQQGPREWIKVNGCKFSFSGTARDDFESFVNLTGFGLIFTSSGQRMISDVLANQKNWNRGMRTVLADPTMALNFAASVLGVAALSINVKGLPVLALLVGVAAGISAGFDAMEQNIKTASTPVKDPQEYSICGLADDKDGKKQAKSCSFVKGWVTKPIRVHNSGSRTPVSVEYYDGHQRINFYPNKLAGITIDAYTASDGDPPQGKCWQLNPPMVRAAANSAQDGGTGTTGYIWCMPAFPPETYIDATIGTIAPMDPAQPFLTNKTWTSGEDPATPIYPYSGPRIDDNNHPGDDEKWYYQMVYDQDSINQTTMWDTTAMRKHFSESTLAEMRKYYCNKTYVNYIAAPTTAPSLDTRCFGYMSLQTAKYTIRPMTVIKSYTAMA
jgi:hypothetical protein